MRGIGIRDDFFDLGGNSLLAMRMLQRAEAACGKMILPASLFRNPTIEHLAGEIAREVIDESPSLLRVHDAGTRTPFFLSARRSFRRRLLQPQTLARARTDQPFYVMPPQDIRLLPAAPTIEEMAATHLQALRAVRPQGPYVIGGFCLGGLIAFELAQQLRARGEKVQMLLIIDAAPESEIAARASRPGGGRWAKVFALARRRDSARNSGAGRSGGRAWRRHRAKKGMCARKPARRRAAFAIGWPRFARRRRTRLSPRRTAAAADGQNRGSRLALGFSMGFGRLSTKAVRWARRSPAFRRCLGAAPTTSAATGSKSPPRDGGATARQPPRVHHRARRSPGGKDRGLPATRG